MNENQNIGDKMRVAGIEAAISIGLLCDALDQLKENSIMAEVSEIINKP